VPVRCGPVLAATSKETAPVPSPLAPAVIVSHDTLLDDVHLQPAVVVTVTVPVPAPPPTVWLVPDNVNEQLIVAAAE
jgi:hypothetical protein